MSDFVDTIRQEIAQAAAQELPVYTPAEWLQALRKFVSDRMALGMEKQLEIFTPELAQLAQSIHLELGEQGLVAMAGRAQTTLTKLLRGTLWFRGGDVEAELLALLSGPRI